MNLQQIYQKLPIGLQNVAVNWRGRRIQKIRYAPQFDQLLKQYEQRSFLSTDEVLEYRDQQLSRFVAHAVKTVPYYRDLFAKLGIDPASIQTQADLRELPILTKAEVQANMSRFISEDYDRHHAMTCHTSGSTGAGLRFPVTHQAHREFWAVTWRCYRLHGLNREMWSMHFGGRNIVPPSQKKPPFWRTNTPGKQILFSAYHLSPETAPYYLEEMQRCGAKWLHGYPSVVSLLAGYALSEKFGLPLDFVSLGAENVLSQQTKTIRRAFGVRPFHKYGMAEGAANISMCQSGNLHIDEDYAAIEFNPQHGGTVSIIGTNFTNPAFPLLRYQVGDFASLVDAECDCQLPGRVVARIDGREEDYLVTKNGAKLGRLDHIFKDMINIREAQFHQSQTGKVELRIVKGPEFSSSDRKKLDVELRQRLGDQMECMIEFTELLPRTDQGKLRLVVSTLAEGSLINVAAEIAESESGILKAGSELTG